MRHVKTLLCLTLGGLLLGGQAAGQTAGNPERNAYFGDLHVHTTYSFDAYIFGTRASPDDAYRFAQGEPLRHPAGFDMQLEEPLDFYAVTDHAVFMGVFRAMAEPGSELSRHPGAPLLTQHESNADRVAAFQSLLSFVDVDSPDFGGLLNEAVSGAAWQDVKEAANRHNAPGEFTTFIGYEYTSGPDFQNLHRNVIFKGSEAPALPFSRLDSANPEDLWEWMDRQREQGMESLAMPHNSNGSNGQMFRLATFDGSPMDAAYASLRMRNEPLVENTQVKGTSDTHPLLSPNDEWADFEIMPFRIASPQGSAVPGSYAREALMNGIALQAAQGFNPFKFGLVGSSDTHNASWTGKDDNYYSKVGMLDWHPQLRGSVPLGAGGEALADTGAPNDYWRALARRLLLQDTYTSNYTYHYWGGSGLAAVWAEANTRGAIYDAFRRKETFSTSGPRIKLRFFAGRRLPAADSPSMVSSAYRFGVPMGGDMATGGEAPEFIVWAMQDPKDVPLQRAQIIKGWVEDGEAKERVYDVACSQGQPHPETHRCPDNGADVDLRTCAPRGAGAAELRVKWRDPDFNPEAHAFYYVRALQNPTCRWSTWDAVRVGVAPRKGLPATLQERAWSSPIWYTP